MIQADLTVVPLTGDVLVTKFLAINTTTGASVKKTIWNFGTDELFYNNDYPTYTYKLPGIYTVSLTAIDFDNNISTKSFQVTAELPYRDYINFAQIPDSFPDPGVITKKPFKIEVLSSNFKEPILVDLFAVNSKSTPNEFIPTKWNFLNPTWKFLDKNFTPTTTLSVTPVPVYKDSTLVAVSGLAEFYYVDSVGTGEPTGACSPILITATLQTSGFNNPTDSSIFGYKSYSNSQTVRAGLIWLVNDIYPNSLKVTANYIDKIYNKQWSGIKIPITITCHSNHALTLPGAPDSSSEPIFTYPVNNNVGQQYPVKLTFTNLQSADYTIDEAPLYFQTFNKDGFKTGGYIFTTVTVHTTAKNTSIVASTTASNPLQAFSKDKFTYPFGYTPAPIAWISNPEKNTFNKITLVPYPPQCPTIENFRQTGNLYDGFIKEYSVPQSNSTKTINYEMSGFSGIYGVAIDPRRNDVIACDAELDRLYRISNTGEILKIFELSSIGDFDPYKKMFEHWSWTAPTTALSATHYVIPSPTILSRNPANYLVTVGGSLQSTDTLQLDVTNRLMKFSRTGLELEALSAAGIPDQYAYRKYIPEGSKVEVIQIFNPSLPKHYISTLYYWSTSFSTPTQSMLLSANRFISVTNTSYTNLCSNPHNYFVTVGGLLQRPNSYTINPQTKRITFTQPVSSNVLVNVIYAPALSGVTSFSRTYNFLTNIFSYEYLRDFKNDPNSSFIVTINGLLQSPKTYLVDRVNRRIVFNEEIPLGATVTVVQYSFPDEAYNPAAYTPTYVSLDKDYNIWVSLFNTVSVLKFDENFNHLYTAIPNNMSWLQRSWAVTPQGIDYQTSQFEITSRRVPERPSGVPEEQLLNADTFTNEFFLKPPVVETDQENNCWVTYANPLCSILVKYSPTGQVLNQIPLKRYTMPMHLAVTPNNNIWVANFHGSSYTYTSLSGSLQLYDTTTSTLLSTVTGISRPGYLAIDRDGDLWFTHSIRRIGYLNTRTGALSTWFLQLTGGFVPYTISSDIELSGLEAFDTYENEEDNDLGGLAVDVYNRVWVIDNLQNFVWVISASPTFTNNPIRNFKIRPDANVGYYLDLQDNFTYTVSGGDYYYRSAQATGDWTGNRWYQKYARPQSLSTVPMSGISNNLDIFDYKNTAQVRRINESFNMASYFKSLALPEILNNRTNLFDQFLPAAVGTGDPEFYTFEDLGQTIYERIANFSVNHNDVDTCNIKQLLSFAQLTDTPVQDFGTVLPTEIRNTMDLASVSRSKLWGIKDNIPVLKDSIGGRYNTQTDYVTANTKIIIKGIFDDSIGLLPVPPKPNTNIYPLSTIELYGLSEPKFVNYLFYRYEPVYTNKYLENVIDWDSPYTLLDATLSSDNDWLGPDGALETAFRYFLTKNLLLGTPSLTALPTPQPPTPPPTPEPPTPEPPTPEPEPPTPEQFSVVYNNYTIQGYTYTPTTTATSLDVVIGFHGTTETDSQAISAAANLMLVLKDVVGINDKILVTIAYPQENMLFGDNINNAEAALLWVQSNPVNTLGINVNNIYLFGTSQGGYLVSRLNTMYETAGIISNAPGPINLQIRCQADESLPLQQRARECQALFNQYGSATTVPQEYLSRSLITYATGHKSKALYIQGAEDTPFQSSRYNEYIAALNNCTDCAPFVSLVIDLPLAGHQAWATTERGRQAVRDFLNNIPIVVPPQPVLFVSGSLTGFNATSPNPSTSQTFTVSGDNLTQNIVISLPNGYEVSTNNNTFSNTLTLTPTQNRVNLTTIYIRLKGGIAADNYSGNVSVNSGLLNRTIAVTGTVTLVVPVLTLQGSFSEFSAIEGSTSPSQIFTITGSSLQENVIITPPLGFEVSTDNSTYVDAITIQPVNGVISLRNLYIRLKNNISNGGYTGFITAVAGTLTRSLEVFGVVSVPEPALVTNSSFVPFSTQEGINSTPQTFTISGQYLLQDVSITPPNGYELSINNVTYSNTLTLQRIGQTINLITVYIRLKNNIIPGNYNGSINIVSSPINRIISITGTVQVPTPQLPTCLPPPTPLTSFTSNIQGPTTYTSFDSNTYSRYVYEGNFVALLIPENYSQGSNEATKMFNAALSLDKIYQFYKNITGKDPINYAPSTYNNKTIIAAEVPTCGFGCGYIGFKGIEINNAGAWTEVKNNILNDQINTSLPYEFGRNFWHLELNSKLTYVTPDSGDIATGYAVFNRLAAFDRTGITPALYNGVPYTNFYNEIKNLIYTYLANPSYTWQTTLRINQGVPNSLSLGATDLFASFCLDLSSRFGCLFVDNVWNIASRMPDRTTTQDSVDNFVLASCSACNLDLRNLFSYYRWTISTNANNTISSKNYPTYTFTTTPINYGGLGTYYTNYNNTNTDVYVSTGYSISAIFDKTPGFDFETTSSMVSALDRWGQILDGSLFNTRVEASTMYNGDVYVPNPLSGVANTTMAIYISSFYANSGDLGNTLGYAGISFKRRGSEVGTNQYNIPYRGFMAFNTYYTAGDVNTNTAGGKNAFYYTALHEIGHTLGIGTNWFDVNGSTLLQGFIVGAGDNTPNPLGIGLSANFFYSLSSNSNRLNTQIGKPTTFNNTTRYIGDADFIFPYSANSSVGPTSRAVSAYNILFSTNLTAIPVENGSSSAGFGSIGSHWEEGYGAGSWGTDNRNYYGISAPGAPGLNDELMTPQAEGIYDTPLSTVTIGALQDLGYTVNYSYADTYNPTTYNIYSNGSTSPFNIGFYGNIYSVPGWTSATNSGKWIVLRRGLTYTFNLNTSPSHRIYIVTQEGDTGMSMISRVTAGVSGDGVGTGTLTWTIPNNQSAGLYYLQCGNHSLMRALLVLY